MFGPVRGPWPNEAWRGWWGETPPFHCDVFVLTNHARSPLVMDGGTVFHFVTGGAAEARDRALAAAKGRDVRLGGGVATIREFLALGWIDRMHLVVSPVILGRGENLLQGIDLVAHGFRVARHVPSRAVVHYLLEKA
jgi:dihydrofolate reductase